MIRRVALLVLIPAVLATGAACAASTPPGAAPPATSGVPVLGNAPTTPQATTPPATTTRPVVIPAVTRTVPRPTAPRLLPDVTIRLNAVNECVWYRASDNTVWLNPKIKAVMTGPGTYPSIVSFNMKSNYWKATAGGGLHPNVAQTWAIQIGTTTDLAAAGHIVALTLNVDPTLEVAESNETNNQAVIHADLTGFSGPPGAADAAVPCS